MSAVKAQRYWIFSPAQDLAFVLLTPLLILTTFTIARRAGWMDALITFALALATAHYLPGILRAYGDRALFRRFRVRLILAPIVLFGVTVSFAYMNLHIVLLLALLWGQRHWMMQVYGFARIYDAKAPAEARTPSWLDRSVCLLWFGMCVFVLNIDLPSYVSSFYESGGPPIPPQAFVWLTRIWFVTTVAFTIVYLVRTLGSIREGRMPNPLKFVFLIVTFVYLSHTSGVAERPLVGLALFESWHDIQYLAIVWVFNINRTKQAPESAGAFVRFLFRPRLALVVVYVAVCLAFGSLTHAWTLFKTDAIVRVVISLVSATGMLHYYMDSFIWKIREKETGEALGVQGIAGVPRVFSRFPVWAPHVAMWMLFAVPVVLFYVRETQGNVAPHLERYERIVEAFPRSASAHYQIGRELQDMGRLREAREHYETALKLAPNMLPAHTFLGIVLSDQGEFGPARQHFERALKMDPRNAELHNNLGIALDELGDLPNARLHLERAIAREPEYALAHTNLAMVLSKQGDASGAVQHLQRALELDPEQYMAHNNLGELLMKDQKVNEAKSHFEAALRIDPDFAPAKKNLAALALSNSPTSLPSR